MNELLGALGAPGSPARQAGEELVALAIALHRPGLERLVTLCHQTVGADALAEWADDPLVTGLLALHDLHPVDQVARAQRALDRVRPYMKSHGGGVELLGIDDEGVAHLRLDGTCHGCPSSTATLANMVRSAMADALPELVDLDVQGLAPPPPTPGPGTIAPVPAPLSVPVTLGPPRVGAGNKSEARAPTVGGHGRCQLCGGTLGEPHGHAVDVEQRQLLCLCRACSIVLSPDGAQQGRYRAVPERVVGDPTFELTDAQWDLLGVPVSTAFFFANSTLGKVVAFYPSPGGATESTANPEAWADLAATNRLAGELRPDVEGLLLRRTAAGTQAYLVPIDACYHLVGLLRSRWKGFDGGSEAHAAVDDFFAGLASRAEVLERAALA